MPRSNKLNTAVSEVIGTVLLLAMVSGLFSIVSIFTLNLIPNTSSPSTNIVCQVDDYNISLINMGGDSLNSDTKIKFSDDSGTSKSIAAKDYLDINSKSNKWDVGEKIVYSYRDFIGKNIRVLIVDAASNSNILLTTISITTPYISVTTLDPTAITQNSANIMMTYSFRNYSAMVRFTYESADGGWINTSWVPKSGSGSYNIIITGLFTSKLYYVKAQLMYNSKTGDGEQKSFMTLPKTYNPPIFSNPSPMNGSTGIPITTSSLGLNIQDPQGYYFNWTITTSPNVGNTSGTKASNGTKNCIIAGLKYSTTYTWIVKANDGHKWTNKSYVFTTGIGTVINTSVNKISPYTISINPLPLTATSDSPLNNVSLYYRWSDDNSSWNGGVLENYVSVSSNTSNVDGLADKGTEINFPNAKGTTRDGTVMTLREVNTGTAGGNEWLNCNSLGTTYTGWTRVGASPFVNAKDYPTHYIYTASNGAQIGWFKFPGTTLTGTLTVNISIYCNDADGTDGADIYVDYTGTGSGTRVGTVGLHTGWQYDTIALGTHTVSEVNNLRISLIYFKSGPASNVWVDHIRIGVSAPAITNYELDVEYQWIAAVYNQANKQVCLYVTSHTGNENLLVNYWTGSAWSLLGTITTTGWSNFTAIGLTSPTYTIQLKGSMESNDNIQDSWNIDVMMLHTWNISGGPHGQNWMIWPSANNPDTSSPWNWSFNFPKGIGYYEFYSIGKDIGHWGGDVELAPASADARCRKI
jgi:hypothetical protein